MERKEVYAQIKSLGLEETVKAQYGKNYTQVSTANLIAVVEAANKKSTSKSKSEVKSKNSTAPKKNVAAIREECNCAVSEDKYNKLVTAVARFIVVLSEDTLKDISNAAKNLTPETIVENINFSEVDIEEMFRN